MRPMRPGPGPQFGPQFEHFRRFGHHGYGWWVLGGLLWLIVVAALITAAVVIGIRLTRRELPVHAPGLAGGPRPPDPAIAELRMRYARGEIARDEYVQRAADLGDAAPPPPPPPPPTEG